MDLGPTRKGALGISWSKPGVGFGELGFIIKEDGTIECDSETMGKKFVMEVLEAFVDSAKFREM